MKPTAILPEMKLFRISITFSAMINKPILFFDSGIGGLSYLDWLSRREVHETFVYFADTVNFPYGEKPAGLLRSIILEQMGRLIERVEPKFAVIACNTASVVALKELRNKYKIPFVGTVPAIKPAAVSTGSPDVEKPVRIGLLATDRTVKDVYTARLIQDFASHCEIIRYGAGNLVNFVEKRLLTSTRKERFDILNPIVDFFRKKEIDALVLGCTHFIFLKEDLYQLLDANIKIIDSVKGVGRQIQRILDQTGRNNGTGTKKVHFCLSTGDNEGKGNNLPDFALRFNLEYKGLL